MKKRVILLGWHFTSDICHPIKKEDDCGFWENIKDSIGSLYKLNSCKKISINQESKEYLIYLISHPKEKNEQSKKKINERIKKIVEDNTENDVLLLLHEIPWKEKEAWMNKLGKNCIVNVFSADPRLYFPKGILVMDKNGCCLRSNKTNSQRCNINDFDWNYIWQSFYIKLSQKKADLLKLWLPLVIDIQGLKELTSNFPENSNKFESYLKDIKKQDYDYNDIIKKHNQIVNSIKNFKNFIIDNNKNKAIKALLNELNNDSPELNNYLQSENENNFLPKFVNRFMDEINEKITKQRN